MELSLRREWKEKLKPKLSGIRYLNGIVLGEFGLVINIEKDDPATKHRIESVFEREAPDVPFVIRLVGRVMKYTE